MLKKKRALSNDLIVKQLGEVLKVGYLKKKGHVRRNWLDRWFVLTSEGIYYYKSKEENKPLGVVPLFGSTVKEDTLQKHLHVFTCWTAEGKDYPIQASTRDEMLVWIAAIEDAAKDKNRRGTVSNGQASQNPGTTRRSDSIPEEKGAVGGPSQDSDDSFDDDE